jgi:Ca-activated chloride channel family protein
MRNRFFPSLVMAMLLAWLGCAVNAQDRGVITGTVIDTAGAPMPGVAVQLVGPETRKTTTDARGAFTFDLLRPGTYQLRFERSGFAAATQSVTVQAANTSQLTVRMAIDAAAKLPERLRESRHADVAAPPPGTPLAATAAPVMAGSSGSMPSITPAPDLLERNVGPLNTEAYDHLDENPFRRVAIDPLSTFSIDVDTASYANVRRFLNGGSLPPPGAVRIEELINYFRFSYPQPTSAQPFSVTTELADCPWNPKHRLALIGLQGRELPASDLPARNLVFLIDVSGSMMSADKLPLVRNAMRMLAESLSAKDRVAIVVYAGSSGLVLPSTPGDQKARIDRAIAELEAGGSTNGGEGIRLAYRVAREHFIRGGVNRVILATDGDFNVGTTSQDELVRLIEEQRATGVFLSVLGVGTGNLKDSTMEKLADKGNGNYAYLDSLHEARKVLLREAGATLVTIAKDVKIQIEFNPKAVAGYRLIGYENRMLRHEDFNDDKKDAGEIGAGHSVTALYEVVPVGVDMEGGTVDPLKYQAPPASAARASADELLTVKLRYKAPDADESRLIATTIASRPQAMTANLGFASAVAEVGMLLRGSKNAASSSFESAVARARKFRQDDPDGYRAEFINLAELAAGLQRLNATAGK